MTTINYYGLDNAQTAEHERQAKLASRSQVIRAAEIADDARREYRLARAKRAGEVSDVADSDIDESITSAKVEYKPRTKPETYIVNVSYNDTALADDIFAQDILALQRVMPRAIRWAKTYRPLDYKKLHWQDWVGLCYMLRVEQRTKPKYKLVNAKTGERAIVANVGDFKRATMSSHKLAQLTYKLAIRELQLDAERARDKTSFTIDSEGNKVSLRGGVSRIKSGSGRSYMRERKAAESTAAHLVTIERAQIDAQHSGDKTAETYWSKKLANYKRNVTLSLNDETVIAAARTVYNATTVAECRDTLKLLAKRVGAAFVKALYSGRSVYVACEWQATVDRVHTDTVYRKVCSLFPSLVDNHKRTPSQSNVQRQRKFRAKRHAV